MKNMTEIALNFLFVFNGFFFFFYLCRFYNLLLLFSIERFPLIRQLRAYKMIKFL